MSWFTLIMFLLACHAVVFNLIGVTYRMKHADRVDITEADLIHIMNSRIFKITKVLAIPYMITYPLALIFFLINFLFNYSSVGLNFIALIGVVLMFLDFGKKGQVLKFYGTIPINLYFATYLYNLLW